MVKIGERQIRFCRESETDVEMEYVGFGKGCDDNDGWFCLHKEDENKIIEIPLAHPKSHLDELRRAFSVPEKYTDELLLQALVGIVIDDYMNVEKIEAENLQDVITDGRVADRWL